MDNDVNLSNEIKELRDEIAAGFRKGRSNTKGLFMISTTAIMIVIVALFHTLVRVAPYTGIIWLMWIGLVFFLFAIMQAKRVSMAAAAEGGDVTLSMAMAEDETSMQGYSIAMGLIIFCMLANLFL